ncbi:MAG: BsuBI/PstI family type II restriction endonuclease [Candidatus Nanopelagicales bacterium]
MLYVGDSGAKRAPFERPALLPHNVRIDGLEKTPDRVVYRRDCNWLVLREAASSHRGVGSKGRGGGRGNRWPGLHAVFPRASGVLQVRRQDRVGPRSGISSPHSQDQLRPRTIPASVLLAHRGQRRGVDSRGWHAR